jgi:hypothetical protein
MWQRMPTATHIHSQKAAYIPVPRYVYEAALLLLPHAESYLELENKCLRLHNLVLGTYTSLDLSMLVTVMVLNCLEREK